MLFFFKETMSSFLASNQLKLVVVLITILPLFAQSCTVFVKKLKHEYGCVYSEHEKWSSLFVVIVAGVMIFSLVHYWIIPTSDAILAGDNPVLYPWYLEDKWWLLSPIVLSFVYQLYLVIIYNHGPEKEDGFSCKPEMNHTMHPINSSLLGLSVVLLVLWIGIAKVDKGFVDHKLSNKKDFKIEYLK